MTLSKFKLFSTAALLSLSIYAFSTANAQVIGKYDNASVTVDEVDNFIKKINRGMMLDNKNSITDLTPQMQENIVRGYIMSKLVQKEIEKNKFKPGITIDAQVQAFKENL